MLKCYFSTGKSNLLATIYLFILQNHCREQTKIINSKCSRVHQAVRKLGEMLNAIFKPKSTEATDEDSVLGTLISRSFRCVPGSSHGSESFMWTFQVGGVQCLEREALRTDTLQTIQIKINSYVNLKRYGFGFFLPDPAFITNVLNMKSPSGI